jgi:hypothetical protein
MKKIVAALAVVALLGACDRRADHDTGAVNDDNDRAGVDTSIKSSSVKDTTIVKADTNIDVDTLKKTDNIKKSKD